MCERDCADRYVIGELSDPERVNYWIPKQLHNGTTSPVVIFMHGFFAPVPEIYRKHIDHLTSQGYIVIFPQYHAAGWGLLKEVGVFEKADQREWLTHAVVSTKRALERIGDKADMTQVFAYGHSIGGLLLLGWEKAGGPKLNGMVLAHPKLNMKTGIPELVRKFVDVRELPWRDLADGITGHVIILGGEDDRIALSEELVELRKYLKNAASSVMYIANSDTHSEERIRADHMTPMTNPGALRSLNWLLNLVGGKIVLDTYDFRFYFAAFDAMLHGHLDFEPDMGAWSDGYPFARVLRVF